MQDEMVRHGKVLRTHVPRPPKYGEATAVKGFGKVYVRFDLQREAIQAKKEIAYRRFNDR